MKNFTLKFIKIIYSTFSLNIFSILPCTALTPDPNVFFASITTRTRRLIEELGEREHSTHSPCPSLASGHTWAGSVGLGGGDWFGSDPLSKRVLHFRPDPLSKSIFVSGTPCQNQYKLSFSEEKQKLGLHDFIDF